MLRHGLNMRGEEGGGGGVGGGVGGEGNVSVDEPQSSLDLVWIFIERTRIPPIGLAPFLSFRLSLRPSVPPSPVPSLLPSLLL